MACWHHVVVPAIAIGLGRADGLHQIAGVDAGATGACHAACVLHAEEQLLVGPVTLVGHDMHHDVMAARDTDGYVAWCLGVEGADVSAAVIECHGGMADVALQADAAVGSHEFHGKVNSVNVVRSFRQI